MSETTTHGNGHAQAGGGTPGNGQAAKTNGQARKTTPRKGGHPDDAALIEQADKLRGELRDVLLSSNEPVKALKRHRRQSRVLQNTIASLRQLKTLGV